MEITMTTCSLLIRFFGTAALLGSLLEMVPALDAESQVPAGDVATTRKDESRGAAVNTRRIVPPFASVSPLGAVSSCPLTAGVGLSMTVA